jgi:hypothetical protein
MSADGIRVACDAWEAPMRLRMYAGRQGLDRLTVADVQRKGILRRQGLGRRGQILAVFRVLEVSGAGRIDWSPKSPTLMLTGAPTRQLTDDELRYALTVPPKGGAR